MTKKRHLKVNPTLKVLSFFRLHGEDNIAIKRYVISFWNGVDLRYKLLQGPSVKISIAGIIISRVCLSLLLIIIKITFLPFVTCPDLNPPSFSFS